MFEKLIVILGPTASGKSDLAVNLAMKFNGEIVSADSRQVYKEMNIGTGKITKKEMKGVPHYLLDVVSPKKRFTAAQYQKLALKAIKTIRQKNKIPFLVGGSPFYIYSIVEGWLFPKMKPDWKLRKELEKKSKEELFLILKNLDFQRAKTIEKENKRRLIRAIEIAKTFGKVPKLKKNPQFDVLMLGIKKNPLELKKIIRKRLLNRLKTGMIAEVKKLKKSGISWKKLEEFGLEYRYIALHLQGKLKKEEMIEKLEKEIEHFAKRQMTWFKRDERIKWITTYQEAKRTAKQFLKG
jgi:tRNA dimethylallyltransferase